MYSFAFIAIICCSTVVLCEGKGERLNQMHGQPLTKNNLISRLSGHDVTFRNIMCGEDAFCQSGQSCCLGATCCPSGTACCTAGGCCPQGTECCADECCAQGDQCCGPMCCSGECCSGGTCCPRGKYCCGNGTCCPHGTVCYSDRTCREEKAEVSRSFIAAVQQTTA